MARKFAICVSCHVDARGIHGKVVSVANEVGFRRPELLRPDLVPAPVVLSDENVPLSRVRLAREVAISESGHVDTRGVEGNTPNVISVGSPELPRPELVALNVVLPGEGVLASPVHLPGKDTERDPGYVQAGGVEDDVCDCVSFRRPELPRPDLVPAHVVLADEGVPPISSRVRLAREGADCAAGQVKARGIEDDVGNQVLPRTPELPRPELV